MNDDAARKWLKKYTAGRGRATIICFHYAGGSAGLFRKWARAFPPEIDVVGVQLPGRADRFLEPPYNRMDLIVKELTPVLVEEYGHRPFVFYGFSMGARVAWALAHRLAAHALPGPAALYLAASSGPSTDDGHWLWDREGMDLEAYVREMGGTPQEVLDEPDLLAALLPVLQADLDVLSTHNFHPDQPLQIPITAFAGAHDPESPASLMDAWRAETTAAFTLQVLDCGHFFPEAAQQVVAECITADLAVTWNEEGQ